jgi:hypothetical protein
MDEVDEMDEDQPVPAQKFHLVYALPYVLALFANLAYVTKVFFAGMSNLLEAHSNYVGNRDLFAAEAGAEIEKLVNGEVDG